MLFAPKPGIVFVHPHVHSTRAPKSKPEHDEVDENIRDEVKYE